MTGSSLRVESPTRRGRRMNSRAHPVRAKGSLQSVAAASVVATSIAAMAIAALSIAALSIGVAHAEVDSPADGAWGFLRPHFYGTREISVDSGILSLEAPTSTPDPTATALTMRFGERGIG